MGRQMSKSSEEAQRLSRVDPVSPLLKSVLYSISAGDDAYGEKPISEQNGHLVYYGRYIRSAIFQSLPMSSTGEEENWA